MLKQFLRRWYILIFEGCPFKTSKKKRDRVLFWLICQTAERVIEKTYYFLTLSE
jgi:hypothetical protein